MVAITPHLLTRENQRTRAAKRAWWARMNSVLRSVRAEDELQRAFGHVDLRDLIASRRIDEDLAVRDVDIAVEIDSYAFAAALHKGLEVCERAIKVYPRVVGDVCRLAADIHVLTRLGYEETVCVKVVAKAPAYGIARGALLKGTARGQKYTAIRRHVLTRFWRGHVCGEHLGQRRIPHRIQVELVFAETMDSTTEASA
jgi:hypothetical protein